MHTAAAYLARKRKGRTSDKVEGCVRGRWRTEGETRVSVSVEVGGAERQRLRGDYLLDARRMASDKKTSMGDCPVRLRFFHFFLYSANIYK